MDVVLEILGGTYVIDRNLRGDALESRIVELNVNARDSYGKVPLSETKRLCAESIVLNRKLHLRKTPFPFEKLAIILEKEKRYSEALAVVNEFLSYEPRSEKFIKRKERLVKKVI